MAKVQNLNNTKKWKKSTKNVRLKCFAKEYFNNGQNLCRCRRMSG